MYCASIKRGRFILATLSCPALLSIRGPCGLRAVSRSSWKLAWAQCFEKCDTCAPLSNNSKVRKRCGTDVRRSASAQNAPTSHYRMLGGVLGSDSGAYIVASDFRRPPLAGSRAGTVECTVARVLSMPVKPDSGFRSLPFRRCKRVEAARPRACGQDAAGESSRLPRAPHRSRGSCPPLPALAGPPASWLADGGPRQAGSDPQRPRAACASELLEGAGARACAPSRPGARTQRTKQVLIPVSGDGRNRTAGGRTARRAYAATALAVPLLSSTEYEAPSQQRADSPLTARGSGPS